MQAKSENQDGKAHEIETVGLDDVISHAPQDARLAAFQAALLELLAEPLSPAEMMERLQHDATFAAFADYVSTFEPRMVEVAAALVKKWGRCSDDESGFTPDELGQMPH